MREDGSRAGSADPVDGTAGDAEELGELMDTGD